jgi:hypothetical protein
MASAENDLFSWIDDVSRERSGDAVFEQLADRFRREKDYRQLFDARLMKKRLELGLPLVSQVSLEDVPKDIQQRYQQGYVEAAREVGELLLADGEIARAWPYFRAVGNTDPIASALERFESPRFDTPESQEAVNSAIHIAFQEGLHPRKGFELILQHYGMCRALTMFEAYPQRDGKHESLRLLVRALHSELVANLKRAIAAVEGTAPDGNSIAALIAGRGWLFENNAQHTDSSHIVSLLRFSCDLTDDDSLKLAVEIADYASHLGPMFQYEEDPPFDRPYDDRGIYLKALLGQEVDRAVGHFEEKAERFEPLQYGTRPGEVLVTLLVRLERHDAAIRAFQRYVSGANRQELSCPSLAELCQMAGDFEQLKQVAREESDPLTYLAGVVQEERKKEKE